MVARPGSWLTREVILGLAWGVFLLLLFRLAVGRRRRHVPPPLSGRHVLVQIETDRGAKGDRRAGGPPVAQWYARMGFKRKDMKKERSVYRGC